MPSATIPASYPGAPALMNCLCKGDIQKGLIESGVVLGLIFEVEGYMDKYNDHFFIFTGGDANYFAEKVKKPIFVVYNLVLMGLAHVAKDYA